MMNDSQRLADARLVGGKRVWNGNEDFVFLQNNAVLLLDIEKIWGNGKNGKDCTNRYGLEHIFIQKTKRLGRYRCCGLKVLWVHSGLFVEGGFLWEEYRPWFFFLQEVKLE